MKAWCTDTGFEVASTALQVHGGMGYIEETGIAQMLRDARIAMIYEGTSGIQALDLVGRKLTIADGRLPPPSCSRSCAATSGRSTPLARWPCTARSAAPRDAGGGDVVAAGGPRQRPRCRRGRASPYLRLFATTLGGFLLARSALAARGTALADSKRASAAFFVGQLLPPATALLPAITAGSAPRSSEAFA